jgi:hypothetical protein
MRPGCLIIKWPGTGYSVLGTGYWVLGVGHWVLGAGYGYQMSGVTETWQQATSNLFYLEYLSLKLLLTTLILLNAIAAPAIIGFRTKPLTG